MTPDDTVQAMVESLKNVAIEIANEGHNGWGNTCTDAAALLLSLQAELGEARKEIGRRDSQILHAEVSLHTFDHGHDSEYWKLYGPPEFIDAALSRTKEQTK